VLALALTRDAAIIAVVAAAFAAVSIRSRRAAELTAVAATVAAPVALLAGASVPRMMGWTFSGNQIPASTDLGSLAGGYARSLKLMLQGGDFPFQESLALVVLLAALLLCLALPRGSSELITVWRRRALVAAAAVFVGLFLVGDAVLSYAGLDALASLLRPGILLLGVTVPLFLPAQRDPFIALMRGGALGALMYLLVIPQATDLRLALVLLPFAVVGLARAIALTTAPSFGSPEPDGAPKPASA
jgi:hypothetical protein